MIKLRVARRLSIKQGDVWNTLEIEESWDLPDFIPDNQKRQMWREKAIELEKEIRLLLEPKF